MAATEHLYIEYIHHHHTECGDEGEGSQDRLPRGEAVC